MRLLEITSFPNCSLEGVVIIYRQCSRLLLGLWSIFSFHINILLKVVYDLVEFPVIEVSLYLLFEHLDGVLNRVAAPPIVSHLEENPLQLVFELDWIVEELLAPSVVVVVVDLYRRRPKLLGDINPYSVLLVEREALQSIWHISLAYLVAASCFLDVEEEETR